MSSACNAAVHVSSTVNFPVVLNPQFSFEHLNPEYVKKTLAASTSFNVSSNKTFLAAFFRLWAQICDDDEK